MGNRTVKKSATKNSAQKQHHSEHAIMKPSIKPPILPFCALPPQEDHQGLSPLFFLLSPSLSSSLYIISV